MFSISKSLQYAMAIMTTLVFVDTSPASAERRVALVMGNAKYKHTVELPNALNDAPAVAAALRRLDFEVVEGLDLTREQMNARMKEFGRLLNGADIGLVFYAGHGMQVQGENYLIPIDAELKQLGDLDYETIKVDTVLKQMFRETKIKIVLLDACRDNPLANELSRSMGARSRSLTPSSGLAQIDTTGASGSVIAFATAPGSIALDGRGSHSPFTEALLEHLETTDLDIDLVMKRVRGHVSRVTGEKQQPWTNSSLNGEFYLRRGAAKVASLAGTVAATDPSATDQAAAGGAAQRSIGDDSSPRERDLWQAAERSGKAADYQAYLDAFPNGKYAVTARTKASGQTSVAVAAGGTGRLVASDVVRSLRSDRETEKSMKLSAETIRDAYSRLALLNYAPGEISTNFGPRARKAISAWQGSVSLVPTGFLNTQQLELLQTTSQGVYDAWVKQGRPKLAALSGEDEGSEAASSGNTSRSSGGRSTSESSEPRRPRTSGGGSSDTEDAARAAGRFFGGVINGASRGRLPF